MWTIQNKIKPCHGGLVVCKQVSAAGVGLVLDSHYPVCFTCFPNPAHLIQWLNYFMSSAEAW